MNRHDAVVYACLGALALVSLGVLMWGLAGLLGW